MEDSPVSMSGRLVAANNTFEELLWRGTTAEAMTLTFALTKCWLCTARSFNNLSSHLCTNIMQAKADVQVCKCKI